MVTKNASRVLPADVHAVQVDRRGVDRAGERHLLRRRRPTFAAVIPVTAGPLFERAGEKPDIGQSVPRRCPPRRLPPTRRAGRGDEAAADGAVSRLLDEDAAQLVFLAGLEDREHRVARLSCIASSGTSALPSRTTEITREPSGSRTSRIDLPAQAACGPTRISTISRFSLRSSSRWIRPCSGTSCSIRAMIDAVADTVGEIPSRSKYGWLRGSFTRAIVVSTP